jgi:Asp/Glu/hydantoin racemase
VGGPAYAAITNAAQVTDTSSQCLPRIQDMAKEYDGFLLAAFVDHPLVPLLQSSLAPKPVVGIFEASITMALHTTIPDTQFVIMTTGKPFEKMLTDGVRRFLGATGTALNPSMFGGVIATEILYGESNNEDMVKAKFLIASKQLLGHGDISVVCLGGAILVGMNDYVRDAWAEVFGKEAAKRLRVIDQLHAGLATLDGLVRMDSAAKYWN